METEWFEEDEAYFDSDNDDEAVTNFEVPDAPKIKTMKDNEEFEVIEEEQTLEVDSSYEEGNK